MEWISIRDIPKGDGYPIRRTFTGLTIGSPVTKAWLTVKHDPGDADPGVLQKIVTTAYVVGQGHIEDDGALTGTAVVRFDLTPADTILLKDNPYYDYFDIQLLVAGLPVTPLGGDISAIPQMTLATS